jgi:hypothetical protein
VKSNHRGLRALLGLICVYHAAVGVIAFLPPSAVSAAAQALLGLKLPAEPALFHVIQSFGVYALVFGFTMGLAAYDPVKNRAMITVGIFLMALRVGQRLAGLEDLERSFGVSPLRNAGTVATVAGIGIALAWFRWRLWREMRTAEAPATR